jgi:hypothetical protein
VPATGPQFAERCGTPGLHCLDYGARMYRLALTVAGLAVCLTPSLRAQASEVRTPIDSSNVLVIDHDFSAAGEYVRAFLQNGQVYRAELSSPDVTLQIRGVIRGVVRPTQLPRIYPFLPSSTPSGTSIVEIYPEVDAEYEIRAVSVGGAGLATRMRLYRDIRASARRHHVRNTPGWGIGVELAGGWHTGYLQSSAPAPLGSDPAGGTDIESCFSARAPGVSRLALCVLGLSYQSQQGGRNILWIYTEPRLRVLGGSPGRSKWELGALFRFGVGIISAASVTPTTIAPGVYIARHIGRNAQGAGWSFQASYARHSYRGFGKPVGFTGSVHPTSNRLSFGVGWYQ